MMDPRLDPRYGVPPPPRANPLLIGHETAEATLFRAAQSGRLAHAWLFSGPKGIGKATLAFRFARFLLAGSTEVAANVDAAVGSLFGDEPIQALNAFRKPASLEVSIQSPVFARIAGGGHADLKTLERGYDDKRERQRGEVVVDDVRDVVSFFTGTAAEGGYRIVVVDSADDMNRNAANALLKVLEEPPPRSVLILISHTPGRLVATLRSRCQHLRLAPLSQASLAKALSLYGDEFAVDDLNWAASRAEGSVGRAMLLASKDGRAAWLDLARLMSEMPDLDILKANEFCERVGAAGQDELFDFACDGLATWFRDLLRVANGIPFPAEPVSMVQDGPDRLAKMVKAAPLDRWLEVWDKSVRLLAQTRPLSLDRRQVLLSVLLDVAAAAR